MSLAQAARRFPFSRPHVSRTTSWTLLAIALGLATAVRPSAAQRSSIANIDRFVAQELARQHIPGVAVGIYINGKVTLAKGYGLSNVELNVPVKPATIFQSGSMGKQFTATAIMMLVEQGKIGLDDSLPRYFPDAPETWRGITIRNLLSHTSSPTMHRIR
jgi:CubicO group peptidase (beta-lactamase class C family)